jgi:methionine-rich copper-binding protein CopC
VLPPLATTRQAGPLRRRLALVALLTLGALATMGAPAWAHAQVEGSEPAPGEALERPPEQVRIWFDQPVEPLRGALQVLGADGIRVDRGDAVDPDGSPDELRISLPDDLPAGEYTVRWRVQAADSHAQEGSWTFQVIEETRADDTDAAGSASVTGDHTEHTDGAVPAADEFATGEPQTALPVATGLTALLAGLLATGLAALVMWRAGELGRATRQPDGA